VALFGHFDRSLGRRLTVLLVGLAFTVPFAVGVIYQNADVAARAALAAGHAPEPSAWVGLVGGLLAFELQGIGPVGEGLLALGAFSVLTVITVGWNPFGMLRKKEQVVDGGLQVVEEPAVPPPAPEEMAEDLFAAATDEEDAESEEAPLPAKRKRRGGAQAPDTGHRTPAPVGDELPPIELLNPPAPQAANFEAELDRLQAVLLDTLKQFKVEGSIAGRTTGPVVTQF